MEFDVIALEMLPGEEPDDPMECSYTCGFTCSGNTAAQD